VSPNLTVCIPAYRSEAFIQNTLRSLLAQTYSDFVVEIAIEPPAEETLCACALFLQDSRVSTIVNPRILGWAGNIKSLLRRVATPYFMILPADDVLQPDYIATLLAQLIRQPQASVAYSDITCFGEVSCRLRLNLTEEPIFDRLMSFFLGGMEAVPFRGLTRSSTLSHVDFPTDQYDGFAVECEWVLHLLISGAAVRVPRPLYLKRTFGQNRISAAAQRLLGRSREQLFQALEDHRARMLALVRQADLSKPMTDMVELAAEAAILRRHMTFNMGSFFPVQLERSQRIMRAAAAMPGKYGRGIQAMGLLAMSQHALIENDGKTALDLAMAAVDADPDQWEGLAHLSRLQLNNNRTIEAFDTARRAWTVAPDARGLRELIADCESTIEQDRLCEMMRNGQAAMLAERFDAAGYLVDHTDVAAAGVDPWKHYCEFGWRERRKIRLLDVVGEPWRSQRSNLRQKIKTAMNFISGRCGV